MSAHLLCLFFDGHIEPIEKNGILVAARIKIYPLTNEECKSFLTPEAFQPVKEYIDFWIAEGEEITKDSPIIRDLIIGDRWGKGLSKLVG